MKAAIAELSKYLEQTQSSLGGGEGTPHSGFELLLTGAVHFQFCGLNLGPYLGSSGETNRSNEMMILLSFFPLNFLTKT